MMSGLGGELRVLGEESILGAAVFTDVVCPIAHIGADRIVRAAGTSTRSGCAGEDRRETDNPRGSIGAPTTVHHPRGAP
jgi:hypothetical protein